MAWLDNQPSRSEECEKLEPLLRENSKLKINIQSIISPLELELKPLSKQLKHAFLAQSNSLPTIISTSVKSLQEDKLLRVLIDHKYPLDR